MGHSSPSLPLTDPEEESPGPPHRTLLVFAKSWEWERQIVCAGEGRLMAALPIRLHTPWAFNWSFFLSKELAGKGDRSALSEVDHAWMYLFLEADNTRHNVEVPGHIQIWGYI